MYLKFAKICKKGENIKKLGPLPRTAVPKRGPPVSRFGPPVPRFGPPVREVTDGRPKRTDGRPALKKSAMLDGRPTWRGG